MPASRPRLTAVCAVALAALMVAVPGASAARTGSPVASPAKKHKKHKHKKHKAPAKCASLCSSTFATIVDKIDSEIARVASTLTVSHAASADNAAKLGGSPPAAFETAGHFVTSGVVALGATGAGATAPLLTVGPITFTERCTDSGSNNFRVDMLESSSEANTVAAGPNGHYILSPAPIATSFALGTSTQARDFTLQYLTPSGSSLQVNEFVGVHAAGHDCVARVNAFLP